jgi:cytoskeleton protein RodZ
MGTFGDTLRQAREDLGVSLADAERETRISRRYLEALEAEDEAALPAGVYTRGFIRTYCHYLGLNADGMLDLFGPRKALDQPVVVRPIPAELHSSSSMPVRPLVLVAGLVLAVLLAGYLWSQYTSFVENVGQLQTAPISGRSAAHIPRPHSGHSL